MNVLRNSRGWRLTLLAALLLSSGCARPTIPTCPPPVVVKPVLPPVTTYEPGALVEEMEQILAPYLRPSSDASPSSGPKP